MESGASSDPVPAKAVTRAEAEKILVSRISNSPAARKIRGVANNPHDAADILQNAALNAWAKVGPLINESEQNSKKSGSNTRGISELHERIGKIAESALIHPLADYYRIEKKGGIRNKPADQATLVFVPFDDMDAKQSEASPEEEACFDFNKQLARHAAAYDQVRAKLVERTWQTRPEDLPHVSAAIEIVNRLLNTEFARRAREVDADESEECESSTESSTKRFFDDVIMEVLEARPGDPADNTKRKWNGRVRRILVDAGLHLPPPVGGAVVGLIEEEDA